MFRNTVQVFKNSHSELDVVRTHSNATTEGRFVVSFCCMTILNELYRRMREETIVTSKKEQVKILGPLAKEMTFNQIRNYLSSIRVVFASNGNCRWQKITKRQQQIAVRLGLPGVYDAVPTWAMKWFTLYVRPGKNWETKLNRQEKPLALN